MSDLSDIRRPASPISMYPRLWSASGVACGELIDRLFDLALENHRSKAGLERSV